MNHAFILASSTDYGVMAAASLLRAGFVCRAVLTPRPKKIGRRQIITPNPVDVWAQAAAIPVIYVNQKITPDLKDQLPAVDFVVVVDFGYYIPSWLIELPRLLAVNLHPSALPAYRGASPGQLVIKNGESHSAMSLITIDAAMDAGKLLRQIPFTVAPNWNAGDYYHNAFTLITKDTPSILAATLSDFAAGKIALTAQSGQPSFAPKITKTDAFIPWDQLLAALQGNLALAQKFERQIRAFFPKPIAWTLAPTPKGEKRLQLLEADLTADRLILRQVKLEGDTTKPFAAIQARLTIPQT